MPDQRNFSSNPLAYRLGRLASVFAVLSVGVGVEATAAENFFESFEGRRPTSRVTFSSETAELAVHRREPVGGIDARGANAWSCGPGGWGHRFRGSKRFRLRE